MEGKVNKKKCKFPGEGYKQKKDNPKKFKGKCFICGKIGHKSKDCRFKGKEKKEVNTTEDTLSNGMLTLELLDMSALIRVCSHHILLSEIEIC